MEDTMTDPRTVCISHGEDADGLTCVALLRRLKDASPVLVTYDDFEDALKGVGAPLEALYICDLNVREALVGEILRINGFADVAIFDHHPAAEGVLEELRENGVTVVHSVDDCASVLLYDHYREEMGREAGRLAAYAAWADQFEDGPIASMLLREFDRQSVQHEALILAHAITKRPDAEFKSLVVKELSGLATPHRIPGASKAALAHLEEVAGLIETLAVSTTVLGRMAYFEAPKGAPTGTMAGLITDAAGVDVGLCYTLKGGDLVNVSIRSRRGLPFHLGEITRRIARAQEGFGGGHKRASGASIPQEGLRGFIDDLDRELSGTA